MTAGSGSVEYRPGSATLHFSALQCTFISRKFGGKVSALQRYVGPLVAHGVTVVGGAEHRDTLPVVGDLVALVL